MIKKFIVGVLFMAGSVTAMADVGVAVSVGQPGFYGQIVLGNTYPAPQVIYPQPVMIQPPSVAIVQAPMYLRVPSGHRKHWGRYCGRYGACGRQVYFVQNTWYQTVYAPRYKAEFGRSRPGHHWKDDHGYGHKHEGPVRGNGRGHGPR